MRLQKFPRQRTVEVEKKPGCRECIKCRKWKPFAEFPWRSENHKSLTKGDQNHKTCIECGKAINKKAYEARKR